MEENKAICPYCEKEIEDVEVVRVDKKGPKSILEHISQKFLSVCPLCRKILSAGGPYRA